MMYCLLNGYIDSWLYLNSWGILCMMFNLLFEKSCSTKRDIKLESMAQYTTHVIYISNILILSTDTHCNATPSFCKKHIQYCSLWNTITITKQIMTSVFIRVGSHWKEMFSIVQYAFFRHSQAFFFYILLCFTIILQWIKLMDGEHCVPGLFRYALLGSGPQSDFSQSLIPKKDFSHATPVFSWG